MCHHGPGPGGSSAMSSMSMNPHMLAHGPSMTSLHGPLPPPPMCNPCSGQQPSFNSVPLPGSSRWGPRTSCPVHSPFRARIPNGTICSGHQVNILKVITFVKSAEKRRRHNSLLCCDATNNKYSLFYSKCNWKQTFLLRNIHNCLSWGTYNIQQKLSENWNWNFFCIYLFAAHFFISFCHTRQQLKIFSLSENSEIKLKRKLQKKILFWNESWFYLVVCRLCSEVYAWMNIQIAKEHR